MSNETDTYKVVLKNNGKQCAVTIPKGVSISIHYGELMFKGTDQVAVAAFAKGEWVSVERVESVAE